MVIKQDWLLIANDTILQIFNELLEVDIRDHSFNTCVKYSEKVTQEMLVFRKILRT